MLRSRKIKIIIGFIVVVAIGYGIARWTEGSSGVPEAFTTAREQGALIAENIVTLSGQSTVTLEQVNELDKEGNYKAALALTTSVVSESSAIRTQAVSLSGQIATMTQALSGISDFNARQAALEAISNQLALLNQLVGYSADLGQLLDVLRNRFTGASGTSVQVDALVNQINTDVNAVNNFNNQAKQAMSKFDSVESGT